MNIPDLIVEHAESLGLTTLATGGGCDYVARFLRPRIGVGVPCLVMSSQEDVGSPITLEEPATVSLYLTPDWNSWKDGMQFQFTEGRIAMDWMAWIDEFLPGNIANMDIEPAQEILEELQARLAAQSGSSTAVVLENVREARQALQPDTTNILLPEGVDDLAHHPCYVCKTPTEGRASIPDNWRDKNGTQIHFPACFDCCESGRLRTKLNQVCPELFNE